VAKTPVFFSKNWPIYSRKLSGFWAVKQGCFAGVKRGMSKGGCGDYND
jgi:hypothetical protein